MEQEQKKRLTLAVILIISLSVLIAFGFYYRDERIIKYVFDNRLAILAGLAALVLVIAAPKFQIHRIRSNTETKGPLELENEYRKTLVQIFGGIVIIATVYSTIESSKSAHVALDLSAKSYELTRRGQVADRTFKAMEMLAKNENNTDAKMAAIYVLSQVAEEDPQTEWTITEILFNYLRLHSHSSSKELPEFPSPVAGAIVDYLRKRPWTMTVKEKVQCVEYHQCFDYQANNGPSTANAEYFKSINLPEVNLRGAFLERVMLKKVILRNSHLEGARLRCGHFEGSYLANAFLSNSNGSGSYWNWANLSNADLTCSNWHKADLTKTTLTNANLSGADLTEAKGLTKEQLERAQGDIQTRLTDEGIRPANWPRTKRVKCPPPAEVEVLDCAQ